MKRISFAPLLVFAMLTMPIAAFAQDYAPAESARVIHNGNTDVIFESAGTANLNVAQLKSFDDFAAEHPDVVSRLSHNPQLLSNDQYLSAHPELAQFVNEHPNFRDEFESNPGNYIHLAPGVERKVEASR